MFEGHPKPCIAKAIGFLKGVDSMISRDPWQTCHRKHIRQFYSWAKGALRGIWELFVGDTQKSQNPNQQNHFDYNFGPNLFQIDP